MLKPLCLALTACCLFAADTPWTAKPLGSTEAPYGYLEHLPADYEKKPKAKHPLVFFLHGLGELGDGTTQLETVAKNGPFNNLKNNDDVAKYLESQSAIVIGPQGLKEDKWWNTPKLMKTLSFVIANYRVDPDRIYVTGLSMGGGGTWAVATAMSTVVAAAVPVCPAAGPGNVSSIHNLPIWGNQAIDDKTVKFPDNMQKWFDALLVDRGITLDQGAMTGFTRSDKPQFAHLDGKNWTWAAGEGDRSVAESKLVMTLYPDGSHNSWSRTYNNKVMWAWMFAQKKK
jgi:predicted peptidase